MSVEIAHEFGPIRDNFSPRSADFGRTRPTFDKIRPNFGRIRPGVALGRRALLRVTLLIGRRAKLKHTLSRLKDSEGSRVRPDEVRHADSGTDEQYWLLRAPLAA